MKENMKKIGFIINLILLTGCQQLMHGASQPVKALDVRSGIYFTTCTGSAESWGDCQDRARQTCPNGYSVTNRAEGAVNGKRELTFQCNK